MARTLHTQPLHCRAARRRRRPHAPRRADQVRTDCAQRRGLKASGLVPLSLHISAVVPLPELPRVRVRRPSEAGHRHPLKARDVRNVLRSLDDATLHGLRAVELMAALPSGRNGVFGAYHADGSGIVRLYPVPTPPWCLAIGADSPRLNRMRNAGAELRALGAERTLACWTDAALRRFMREVLLHEIGHHVFQWNAGKRRATVARQRDHEARADLLIRRWPLVDGVSE